MSYRRTILVFVCIAFGALIVSRFAHALDLDVYRAAGQSLLEGRTDLYSADFAISASLDYHYPPIFLLIFWPLALLPKWLSVIVWSFLTLGAIYCALRTIGETFAEFFERAGVRYALIATIAVLLSLKYLLLNLKYLNVHLIVLALTVLVFCFVTQKKPVAASFLMAGAVALKVFPILLLPYFVVKREFRFITLTFLFLFIFAIAPALYFGLEANVDLHSKWMRHAFIDTAYHELNGPIDASIVGVTSRYLSEVPYQDRVTDQNYSNINLIDIGYSKAQLVGKILAGLILSVTYLVVFFSGRHKPDFEATLLSKPPGYILLFEFGLVVCMMLMVIPRTPVGYFVAVLIPLVFLITVFAINRDRFSCVLLSAVAAITCVLPLVPTARFQRLTQVVSVDFVLAAALWIAMVRPILSRNSGDLLNRPMP